MLYIGFCFVSLVYGLNAINVQCSFYTFFSYHIHKYLAETYKQRSDRKTKNKKHNIRRHSFHFFSLKTLHCNVHRIAFNLFQFFFFFLILLNLQREASCYLSLFHLLILCVNVLVNSILIAIWGQFSFVVFHWLLMLLLLHLLRSPSYQTIRCYWIGSHLPSVILTNNFSSISWC